MKTYKEVAEDVFRKGDEYLLKKKKRNKYIITSTVAFCAAVCCIAALSIKDHSPNSTENKVSDIETSNSMNDTTEQSTSSSEVTSGEENISSDVETSNSTNNTKEQSTSNTKVASKENNTEARTDAVYNSTGDSEKKEFTTQIPEQYNSSNETVQSTDNTSGIYSPAGSYNSRGMLENAKKYNTIGWIKYNGKYYLQNFEYDTNGYYLYYDNFSSLQNGTLTEKLGTTSDFEGNADKMGLSGDVYAAYCDATSEENPDRLFLLVIITSDGKKTCFYELPLNNTTE